MRADCGIDQRNQQERSNRFVHSPHPSPPLLLYCTSRFSVLGSAGDGGGRLLLQDQPPTESESSREGISGAVDDRGAATAEAECTPAFQRSSPRYRRLRCRPRHFPPQPIPVVVDINDPYTRNIILSAFAAPGWDGLFDVHLGPGHGDGPVPVPQSDTEEGEGKGYTVIRRRCFQFAEYERIDWEAVHRGEHGAASFHVRKGLSRKAQLAHYVRMHCAKHPGNVLERCIPRTEIVDTWAVWDDDCGNGGGGGDKAMAAAGSGLAGVIVGSIPGVEKGPNATNRKERLKAALEGAKEMMDEAESEFCEKRGGNGDPPMWILKPSTINKGAGIRIVHCVEQVIDACWEESDIREWVLQRYVSPPLLLNGRKFHIRAYALAVGAIRVYLADRCLALCSGTPYDASDTDDTLAHITNTAHQAIDPNFREEECVLPWYGGDKKDDGDGDAVPAILVRDGTCPDMTDARAVVKRVTDDMKRITGELFRAYRNEPAAYAPLDGCFEQYGLDFVVDAATFGVCLLEVNPGPDFRQTGDRLSVVVEEFMADTIDVVFLRESEAGSGGGGGPDEERVAMERLEDTGFTLVYERRVRGPPGA